MGLSGKTILANGIDIANLARNLTGAVHQAGARIMGHYGRAQVDLKDDNSPVTEADREADRVLVSALAEIAPDVPVVSEESSPRIEIDTDAPFFLVDPLDGTREFINGRTEFTVNVALIENRTPVFGVVYAPAASALYIAPGAGGAFKAHLDAAAPYPGYGALTLTPISSRTPPQAGLTAAVSRSHLDPETQAYLEAHGITETFASGSSLKFCCIAEGSADIYPRFGRTMEWDTAAGHAVLSAAGGAVLRENGEPFLYGKRSEGYANLAFIAWGRKP